MEEIIYYQMLHWKLVENTENYLKMLIAGLKIENWCISRYNF